MIYFPCEKKAYYKLFDKVHSSNHLLFCFYTNEIIKKKGKEIYPYNKEHCLPRYYFRGSSKSYDNNLHNLIPIKED